MSVETPTPANRGSRTAREAPVAAPGKAPGRAAGRRTSTHVPGLRASAERASIVVLGKLLHGIARAMLALARVTPIGRDEVLRHKAAGRRLIFVSWHGFDLCNLAVFPVLYGKETPAVIMAPMNREGRVMEQLATAFHYTVIPIGADERSPVSARAVVEMVSTIRRGADGLIAVDGPHGPPEQAKLGAAVIAKRAGAIIVPTTVAGSAQFRVRSRWDKHLFVLPFARMIVHFGPLIDTQSENGPAPSADEIRERVQAALSEGVLKARTLARGGAANV